MLPKIATADGDAMVRAALPAFLSLLLFFSGACRPQPTPEEVWVPEGATDLKVRSSSIGYTTHDAFPANRVREGLERQLSARGYKRLNRDALDLTGTETVSEWRSYIDGRSGREQCRLEIVEDWQNAGGDVVRLVLGYEGPCDKNAVTRPDPSNDTLRVEAAILNAADIDRLREAHGTTKPK